MDRAVWVDWGRRLRARRGPITQVKLAQLAAVDQAVISKIERGIIAPTDNTKWRLAGALGCTVDDLFPWPAVRPPVPVEVAS